MPKKEIINFLKYIWFEFYYITAVLSRRIFAISGLYQIKLKSNFCNWNYSQLVRSNFILFSTYFESQMRLLRQFATARNYLRQDDKFEGEFVELRKFSSSNSLQHLIQHNFLWFNFLQLKLWEKWLHNNPNSTLVKEAIISFQS